MVRELKFQNSIRFEGRQIPRSIIKVCFEFAYAMADGKHRENRSGGSESRKPNQIFANAFQGKLAECILYNILIQENFTLDQPDFGVYERGEWDSLDLEVNQKSISIKSTSYKGNFLLLETKDHDNNGVYLPSKKAYDYTVLIRIKDDLKQVLKGKRMLFDPSLSSAIDLKKIIDGITWEYDIAGYITNQIFKEIISDDQRICRGGTINTYTVMDAENYYIESGNMLRIEDLFDDLRN